jgi:hypothetical protein
MAKWRRFVGGAVGEVPGPDQPGVVAQIHWPEPKATMQLPVKDGVKQNTDEKDEVIERKDP